VKRKCNYQERVWVIYDFFNQIKKDSAVKLEAEIGNLKKILVDDETFYQIPDYQRPYSWDKDNIAELIEDLVDSYMDNNPEDYFCGSLVLVENKYDNRLDVIDGQQRLTTFTIMACVFRDLYLDTLSMKAKDYIVESIQDKYEDNKRKLKFLTDERYQIDFEETVLKKIVFQDVKNIEKSFPQNRYLQNAYYIKELLMDKFETHSIDVDNFIIWFYEQVVLTVIICPSQDSAIQIFNVLNDRGMPLSPMDILKSSLMRELSKEDRRAFVSKWELINNNLDMFDQLTIDAMLNTYLYYKITTNPRSRLDKELLSVFKKEDKNSLEIISEISAFSNAYIETMTLEDKYIYCFKYLRHKIYWQSIMTTAYFVGYKNIKRLKELLLAYYYQNWVAGATVARIKQTSFNILRLVKENRSIEDIKSDMESNMAKYATTKLYKENLKSSYVYGSKWDRAILLLSEYFSLDESSINFIPINKSLHLEHILPQTVEKTEWEIMFSAEERERWTNSLANLTLLSMRKNIQAQNFGFVKKKEAYQNKDNLLTSFKNTQDILTYTKWDIEALEDRESVLIQVLDRKLDLFYR